MTVISEEKPAKTGQNPEARQNRLANGQFAPGSVHNPGGRPRTRFISEALRDALANGDAGELAAEALRLAKRSKYDSVRLAAIAEIADRTEGKPVQAHKIEGAISADVARSLAELAATFAPIQISAEQCLVIGGAQRPLIDTPKTGQNGS